MNRKIIALATIILVIVLFGLKSETSKLSQIEYSWHRYWDRIYRPVSREDNKNYTIIDE